VTTPNNYPIVDPVMYHIEERDGIGEWRKNTATFTLETAREIASRLRRPDRIRIIKVTKENVT
jgi:hypothetical protein